MSQSLVPPTGDSKFTAIASLSDLVIDTALFTAEDHPGLGLVSVGPIEFSFDWAQPTGPPVMSSPYGRLVPAIGPDGMVEYSLTAHVTPTSPNDLPRKLKKAVKKWLAGHALGRVEQQRLVMRFDLQRIAD